MKQAATFLLLIMTMLPTAAQEGDSRPVDPKQAALSTEDYYIEVEVSNPAPYVGEQIIYMLRYYAFYLPDQFPYTFPSFEGFWLSQIFDGQEVRVEAAANRQFYVGEVLAEITPLEAGEIVIAPAVFEVDETVFRSGTRLESESLMIDVRPLPDGAPESFNGAVGQFDVRMSADRDRVLLGEPVLLEMVVDGLGTLELLPAPELPDVPGWRVYTNPVEYDESAIGGTQFGQKVFRWALIPTNSGTQTYPAVNFSYFDPRQGTYRTVVMEPITVEVFPGVNGEQSLAEFDATVRNQQGPLALKPIEKLDVKSDSAPVALAWALWGIFPAITAMMGLWRYERQRTARKRLERRKAQALTTALRRLETTRDPETIIQEFISDKLGVSSLASGTPGNHIERLEQHGIDAQLCENLAACLAEAESIRYLPAGSEYDLEAMNQRIARVLKAVDSQWQP